MTGTEKIMPTMPESQIRALEALGYRVVTGAAQRIFDPFYDSMNDHWSCAAGFLSLLAWGDLFPVYYKQAGEFLICLEYEEGELLAIPFIGRYTSSAVASAFRILQKDLEALGFPLTVMEVSPWMLPCYQETGVTWDITDDRDLSDYIYQRDDFLASMNGSDSRYRYRYFLRRFAPEPVALTKERREECLACMEEVWCSVHDCSYCHYGCPKAAVSRLLDAYDELWTAGGLLVRVNGRAVGFCITECRNGLGIYYFKYAENHLKGVNEYLLRECFDRFLSEAEEINYTNDMGVENLRAYKMKLSPYTLLPKLRLRAAEERGHAPVTRKDS